ncbi:PMS1 protein homolog 1 [Nephila pilipes]|uniref:PMS1 protein homolog 1 n=1 Tax=Nephila pilipes TaxID=299642 RepID=A0A8X6N5Q7_NEPPI|nr:PMS1 protein homolog 1 [Nephila pilipes]
MSRIKELPKSSSHLLSCSQIITSPFTVVKELVENGLDSCSTNIEVRLVQYGLEKIQVKDNGKGICESDIHFVAKPHCTSKITSHSDLSKVETYGFRGEALAAICAVSDLEITTRSAGDEIGLNYQFDHQGNVLSSNPCPFNLGTSVIVSNLFENFPVRKKIYQTEKIKKDELRKIEDLLISFGCILKGVRFVLFHNQNLIWQKVSVDETVAGLQLCLGSIVDHLEKCEYVDEESQIKIEVFLPRCNAPAICGQTSANRSIVAINKRPVRMKVIDKLLKEYYTKSLGNGNKSRFPVCYVSIEVPSKEIDVNFEPNKTAVALHNTGIITDQLTKLLSTFYDINSDNNNAVSGCTSSINSSLPDLSESEEIEDINNTSNSINLQNNRLNFHLKQTQLACEFQNTNPKERLALSKKLSRKNDSNTPSSKRVKTSKDFSTPPNDIYKHINTLESFFSSANDNVNNTSFKVSNFHLNESNAENPGINKICNQSCIPNQNSTVVTVQRESNNVVGNGSSVLYSVRKNSLEMLNSHLEDPCNGVIKEINKEANCAISCDDGNNSLCNETGKVPPIPTFYVLNKEMNQDTHLTEANEKLVTVNEKSQNAHPDESKENKSVSSVLTSNDWSRGLHPIEVIQPVSILKPKVVGTISTNNEEINDVVCLDRQESCETTLNQRKMTPFDFFCRKYRLEVASMNPDFNNQQIAQILTEKWNHLPPEEKAVFKSMVSKDYPKNIKNKEKLGKVVNENLNKIKDVSYSSKKIVQKKKRRRIERNVIFSMQKCNMSNSNFTKQSDLSFVVINCLAPGIWICSQKDKLYLLNCYRLQEAVIYHRLLETYEFEAEIIESSLILSASSLGNDAMDVILQMDVVNEFGDEFIVSDKRLTANGFKLKILQGNGEAQIEVIGMTNSMAFYGVPDLKEILSYLKDKGFSAKLSDCRPGKAILYLQGEAVRIARQSPTSKKIEEIEDLMKKIDSLPSQLCLHSKPFFTELYTFDTD